MPANYLAAIRYHVIDRCLRDRSFVWQWSDLALAISAHIADYTGESVMLSRRTIMADIHAMRSGVLGYQAPIEYSRREGYHYYDHGFTIHKAQIPASLVQDFEEALSLLRQNMGSSPNSELIASLTRIADHLRVRTSSEYTPIIYLEHSLNDPGYRWLDQIYQMIKNKKTIRIDYQPFNGQKIIHVISPWFIKEFNNRWYVFGQHHQSNKIYNLAMDRISAINHSLQPYRHHEGYAFESHFDHLYGVTIPEGSAPVVFTFETTTLLARYMDTKPIHRSQKKEYQDDQRCIYSLLVYDNYEIRSKLRSFGEDLKVLEPK